MKSSNIFLCVVAVAFLSSCNKEETKFTVKNVFVQTIVEDNNFAAVGSLLMEDGSYLVASGDQKNYAQGRVPGHLVKFDASGKMIWDKRVSEKNNTLWKVIALPGTGFATFGSNINFDYRFYLCKYDYNGNLLSENRVNANISLTWAAPFDIIRLSNGNFAIAGGDESSFNIGYLKILDPDCNLLYSKIFYPPEGYNKVSFRGICEQPDGNIALTAATANQNNSAQNNLMLIRTTPQGQLLSSLFLEDLNHYETVCGLSQNSDGLVAVTSGLTYGDSYGTYVNYLNNTNGYAAIISGDINLNRFNSGGKFISRKTIRDFPGNGLMSSIRTTNDGGYILCGTVGQSNLATLVSFTKIYLLKIDADLNVQWKKIIDTTYPGFGVDAFETSDGGYLVSGYQKSFNTRYEVMVIKTDAYGNFY